MLALRRAVTICSVAMLVSLLGSLPAVAAGPTPYVQECNAYMQAPWVALYEYANFQGQSICVMGTGSYNLNAIGWANRASSVNIGADGYVTDGSAGAYPLGRYMPYHYGVRIADLRSIGWDDRFQNLRTNW